MSMGQHVTIAIVAAVASWGVTKWLDEQYNKKASNEPGGIIA